MRTTCATSSATFCSRSCSSPGSPRKRGAFDFDDVAEAICAKLIRRHPHVFDATGAFLPPGQRPDDPAAIKAAWGVIKAQERAAKAAAGRGAPEPGPLAGVPLALPPALARADAISRRAAATGFDWPDAGQVLGKVREEVDEVEESLRPATRRRCSRRSATCCSRSPTSPGTRASIRRRPCGGGTLKFERRFTAMAARLDAGLEGSDLAAMEAAWQAVKRTES